MTEQCQDEQGGSVCCYGAQRRRPTGGRRHAAAAAACCRSTAPLPQRHQQAASPCVTGDVSIVSPALHHPTDVRRPPAAAAPATCCPLAAPPPRRRSSQLSTQPLAPLSSSAPLPAAPEALDSAVTASARGTQIQPSSAGPDSPRQLAQRSGALLTSAPTCRGRLRAAWAMASTAAAGSACAYCGDDLPAYERWVCCTCCPSGPVAPWHSCGPCALQRSIGGTGAAAPPAKVRRRSGNWVLGLLVPPGIQSEPGGTLPPALQRQRTAVDSSTPCFEDGHRFEPVVRPGSGWLTLEPGPEEGKRISLRQPPSCNRPAAIDVSPLLCAGCPCGLPPRQHPAAALSLPSCLPSTLTRRQAAPRAPLPAGVPPGGGATQPGLDLGLQQPRGRR